jgi:two-component system response regulator YesN
MYTILIADDERIERDVVKNLIGESGCEANILEAKDGKEAWELAKVCRPDIIFSDINMPFMTGLELTKNVRKIEKEMVIILFSGSNDFHNVVEALRLGVTDYLPKPIEVRSFRAALMKAMAQLEDSDNGISKENIIPWQERPQTNDKSSHSAVERVKNYIYNHYSEPLSVEVLASKVFLSPGYLSYIFKRDTGEGISQFISTYRMEKAKKLLVETNMKIVQISRVVGFNNSAYFGRSFKEYQGISPEQYRKSFVEIGYEAADGSAIETDLNQALML